MGIDALPEWLSRWTRNPLNSVRKCGITGSLRGWSLEATPVALADKAEEHRSNHKLVFAAPRIYACGGADGFQKQG